MVALQCREEFYITAFIFRICILFQLTFFAEIKLARKDGGNDEINAMNKTQLIILIHPVPQKRLKAEQKSQDCSNV